MKKKIFLISLSMIILLINTSCKEDSSIINQNGNINFFSGISGGNGGYDLLLAFDNPNVMGIVEFESVYQDEYHFDIYNFSGNFEHYEGESFGLEADIANPQRSSLVSLSPASIVANAFQMQQYQTGRYYVPSHLDIENYFGTGYNKIMIDSNQYFNKLVDSVSFGNAIRITNVPVGTVVDRNTDFVVNFSGASATTPIEYELLLIPDKWTQYFDTNSLHTSTGARHMKINDGQVVFPANVVQNLKSGYYSLTILAYEPKFVSLSNGKQLCMLGLSEHRTTIKIED